MQNGLFRKGMVFEIVGLLLLLLLFVSIGSVNSYSVTTSELTTWTINDSSSLSIVPSTVHNLDTGEDFQTIQEAIDDEDTKDGHTIQVDAGVYYENVVVNKSISLEGVDRYTTIINGGGCGNVVNVTADCVNINGFTIENSGYQNSGVCIFSKYNVINGNNIGNNWYGILIWYSSNNNINGNDIGNNEFSILISHSSNNNINGNNISNNENGIDMWDSYNNTINDNKITDNNKYSFLIGRSSNNEINGNNIVNSWMGIYIWSLSNNNIFYNNNFISNTQNTDDSCSNIWDNGREGNYWDDYKNRYPNANKIWLKGVWDIPYDIHGGDNQDRYPLIKPYSKSKLNADHLLYTNNSIFNFLEEILIVSTNEILSKNFISDCLYIDAPSAPLWVRLR